MRDKGRGTRSKGRGIRGKGQGARSKRRGTRSKGQGARGEEQGARGPWIIFSNLLPLAPCPLPLSRQPKRRLASSCPTTRPCSTCVAKHSEWKHPAVRSRFATAVLCSDRARALATASIISIPKPGASAPLIRRLSPCSAWTEKHRGRGMPVLSHVMKCFITRDEVFFHV